MQQFMVLVYFTAALAICGIMANRSNTPEMSSVKQNRLLYNGYTDRDTIIYNHFTQ